MENYLPVDYTGGTRGEMMCGTVLTEEFNHE